MKTRIITSLVALCLFLPFLYFSDTLAFLVLIQLLAFVSTYEILSCVKLDKYIGLSVPCYAAAILVPYLCRYPEKMHCNRLEMMFLIFFVLTFVLLSAGVFYRGKVEMASIGILAAMEFYVIFAVSSILLLRDIHYGGYVYLLVFIASWVTDTGAYFAGKTLGRHKLIPEVSPKKTIEGSIGAVIGTGLTMLLYGLIVSLVTDLTPNYLVLAISGPILSLVGQIGDLFASLLKREHGIKDYGNLMPGHGGIMDRFDSILAVACATMIIVLTAAPFA